MSSGGGSSSGDVTVERRYAPYIELAHSGFLDKVKSTRDLIIDDSPYDGFTDVEVDIAFFGLGYTLANMSALYAMFGTHMTGINLSSLWEAGFNNVMSRSEIDTIINKELSMVDDKVAKEDIPSFQVSLRNLNAVPTTTFVVGRAIIEGNRIKTRSKISLSANAQMLSEIGEEFATKLNWEKKVIVSYALLMKSYFGNKVIQDDFNYTLNTQHALWPFTALSFEQAALGVMQSKVAWQKTQGLRERSTLSKVLLVGSYAATGYAFGGPVGAVVGTVIGIAVMLLE